MTLWSFRIDEAEAVETQRWAERLGLSRSELLRDALHRHLAMLASQSEPDRYDAEPLTSDELALAEIADWGPAEDWSDWADAAG